MTIATFTSNPTRSTHFRGLPSLVSEPRWYAIYSSPNCEKRVADQLTRKSIEHFLPLYRSVRQWKDRKVTLQLPLFPGYVFVRFALPDRLQVLEVPRVVRLVGFNGAPAALDETEIESLRRALIEGVRAEPYPRYLEVGRRVRIIAGPLAGREGIVKRWRGDLRVVLSTELIRSSIQVDVDAYSVVPAQTSSTNADAPVSPALVTKRD